MLETSYHLVVRRQDLHLLPLETHPTRQSLEIHLTHQFHQFHHQLIRTLGQVYHQQGGLYHQVINLRQALMYLQVLL